MELTDTQIKWLEAFQGKRAVGSFFNLIVQAVKIADANNQRALKGAFPEVYEGYELWLSGEYNI